MSFCDMAGFGNHVVSRQEDCEMLRLQHMCAFPRLDWSLN